MLGCNRTHEADRVHFMTKPAANISDADIGAQMFVGNEIDHLPNMTWEEYHGPPKMWFYRNNKMECEDTLVNKTILDIHLRLHDRGYGSVWDKYTFVDREMLKAQENQEDGEKFDWEHTMTKEESEEYKMEQIMKDSLNE